MLAVIASWSEVQRIGAYFAEVERAAELLGEEPQRQLLERLNHARALIGSIDPAEQLFWWKAPTEQR